MPAVGAQAADNLATRIASRKKKVKVACTTRATNGTGGCSTPKPPPPPQVADDNLPDWIQKKPEGKGPRGYPIPIHVLRINILQLQTIDQVAQTFMARFLIQLSIPQGALDTDLVHDLDQDEPEYAPCTYPMLLWASLV